MKIHRVGSRRPGAAFTPLELLVIIGVLGLLIAVILPTFRPQRHSSARIRCVNNLKNIGLAFRIFATDNQDLYPMQIITNENGTLQIPGQQPASHYFALLSNELSTPKILACPMDKKCKPASNFYVIRNTGISYFVGLDAAENLPNSFLSGDRNLMTNGVPVNPGLVQVTTNMTFGWTKQIHNRQGNVAMGDGSVQQFSNVRVGQGLLATGLVTNQFLVP